MTKTDIRKFTSVADLVTSGKLVYNDLAKTYAIDEKSLDKGEEVLMSHKEFIDGGSGIKGVPVTITLDGKQPVFDDIDER